MALILFDVVANRAYSLIVQQYFATHNVPRMVESKASMALHFTRRDRLTPAVMRRLAKHRDAVLAQLAAAVHYD